MSNADVEKFNIVWLLIIVIVHTPSKYFLIWSQWSKPRGSCKEIEWDLFFISIHPILYLLRNVHDIQFIGCLGLLSTHYCYYEHHNIVFVILKLNIFFLVHSEQFKYQVFYMATAKQYRLRWFFHIQRYSVTRCKDCICIVKFGWRIIKLMIGLKKAY